MGKRQKKCRWREAVGLGCWTVRCLCCTVQDPTFRGLCPWQGNLEEGLVLSWAARQGEKCIVPVREGLETGFELPTGWAATPGMPAIPAVPWGEGAVGQESWGKWMWLCWMVQDAQHQHLLSLQLPAGGVFKEFLIPPWKGSTWRGCCRFRSVPTWQPGVAHPRPVAHPRQMVLQEQ